MSEEKNILKTKSIDFALSCIRISKELMDSQKEFILSKQFLKSGTSIGANIHEAQNAESKADFIHKLAIAQKECGETIYWITLLQRSCYIDLTSSA
ncbi:MAG: four helix bundle protein [Saprospiraceae bacterium]|nr:four helix bundle protein [Saprospiraceae bacterium]HMW39505.1 four helix bundle protein [Saprospiraceae bacterium]HMX89370.1 four helix bundle protein [Saprospiraceae bacterium]HMZ41024.1 four helix bundle protein [Saprospiraceae bacterium]HNA65280.1 four helix bundle protein [Saprospiraceae bacterium]